MKLPNKFITGNHIKDMKIGQSGYIVPWGMHLECNGECFLNENYTYHDNPGGTVQLKITRIVDGYVAHVNE